jgi:hypothetical protein
MNKTRWSVCLFGAVGLVLVVGSPAGAAKGKVYTMNLRGPLINGYWSTPDPSDPSGCRYVEAFLTAQDQTSQDPSGTVRAANAAVNIDTYDYCTGSTLSQAIGERENLPAGQMYVNNQLNKASLHTTINVADLFSSNTFDVTVDVTFVGTSVLMRNHSNTNDIYSRTCHVLNRWKGTGRTASAWGVISDGTTNYALDTSTDDEIGNVVSGAEIVGCP